MYSNLKNNPKELHKIMAYQVQDELFEEPSSSFEPIFEDEIRSLSKKKDPNYKKLETACWNRFTTTQDLKKSDRAVIKKFAHHTLHKHNEALKNEKRCNLPMKIACMTCFFAGAWCQYMWASKL